MQWVKFTNETCGLYTVLSASAQTEGSLRLVGGDRPTNGRVEIFHNNTWGELLYVITLVRNESYTFHSQYTLGRLSMEIIGLHSKFLYIFLKMK